MDCQKCQSTQWIQVKDINEPVPHKNYQSDWIAIFVFLLNSLGSLIGLAYSYFQS